MKPRDNLIRAKQFQLEDARRRLAQIEVMVGELMRMAGELDQQIDVEEKKSGVTDPEHFAYPTFARAARQRRDNLLASIDGLAGQRAQAADAVAAAETDLATVVQKAERADERLVTARVSTLGGRAPARAAAAQISR